MGFFASTKVGEQTTKESKGKKESPALFVPKWVDSAYLIAKLQPKVDLLSSDQALSVLSPSHYRRFY